MKEALLKIGFLTGSRAFGTAREDSDYDIVYSIDDQEKIDGVLGSLDRFPSTYFAGYWVQEPVTGDKLNLIPVHPHEFLCWYLATKTLKSTLQSSGIKDPIKKYAIFQGVVCLFKGTVEQRQNLKAYDKLKPAIIAGTL